MRLFLSKLANLMRVATSSLGKLIKQHAIYNRALSLHHVAESTALVPSEFKACRISFYQALARFPARVILARPIFNEKQKVTSPTLQYEFA